jgi:NAD(P)H dehydrogenase (quinone)
MSNAPLLVTGASGKLGRRVVELLLERGEKNLIATTRNPASLEDLAKRGVTVRAATFDDESSLVAAFRGAERLLLVSTDALDTPGKRLAQHRAAIRAAEAAGVRHVVYTSLTNPYPGSPIGIAEDHRLTEAALESSKLEFTVLRNDLYADLFLQALPPAIAQGRLVDARGNGKTAFVTREDCARVAAAALASGFTGRRTLEVTGSEALSSADVAGLVGRITGKKIEHLSLPGDVYVNVLVEHGLPRPFAEVLSSFDAAILKGDLAPVSNAVRDLTGKEPIRLEAFLTENRAALGA